MIIQKKYHMILLFIASSVSYGMQSNSLELFADVILRDPLDLGAFRRALEIRKTTEKINGESQKAAKIDLQSNGHYELVKCNGPINVVISTKKEVELPKPKL